VARFAVRALGCIRVLGLRSGLWHMLRSRLPGEYRLRPRGLSAPILLRGGGTDAGVLERIFVAEEYPLPGAAAPCIIDLGAHAGFAARYFVQRCPGARVLAVEPDPDNLALLRRNTASCRGIQVLAGAAWSHCRPLRLASGRGGDGSRVETETGGGIPVDGYDMPALLRVSGFDRVDLLKVDIEGAERALFAEGAAAWLGRVDTIAIEVHDHYAPGAAKAVLTALAGVDYRLAVRGENLIIALGQAAVPP
jgi:FkbM family methyltransferase